MLALLAFFAFETWPASEDAPDGSPRETHTARLATALVEFHKAQCYFAIVIQITALSLFHQSKANAGATTSSLADEYNDPFDTSVLTVLATGGLIPISLTLACITRYGSRSWYLLILSLISTILATVTLISSYYYDTKYAKPDSDYQNNLDFGFDLNNGYGGNQSCDLSGLIGSTILDLCGNSNLLNNSLPSRIVASGWTWAIYANCVLWLSMCLGIKCMRVPWIEYIVQKRDTYKVWTLISIIPWLLCFSGQFYLFAAYYNHAVISSQWSFGQIIAVTVGFFCCRVCLYRIE